MKPRRFFHHAALLSLFLGTAVTWSASSRASDQPAVATLAEQAAQFYRAGNLEFEKKSWALAEAQYLKAWAITRTFDVAANLGEVEFHLGKPREAAGYLSYSLRTAPPSFKPEQRERTKYFLAQVKDKIASVRVRVSVEGADIVINGKSITAEELAQEVYVDPGTCTVVAKRAGYVESRTTVEVKPGSLKDVVLTLDPVPPEQRSVAPGITLGGIAVLGVAAGIGVFVAGDGKRSTAEGLGQSISDGHGSCVAGAANFDARCPDLAEMSASADTLHKVGFGLLIGGGAAAAGAVTYLLWPSSKPTTAATVRVLPVATTTGGGLFMTGSF